MRKIEKNMKKIKVDEKGVRIACECCGQFKMQLMVPVKSINKTCCGDCIKRKYPDEYREIKQSEFFKKLPIEWQNEF